MISVFMIVFTLMYAAFLFWCRYHWNKIQPGAERKNVNISIAVVVPMRNESANILSLLRSLSKQKYSNFEVILCDDHSTDETYAIVQNWINENKSVKAKCIRSDFHSKKMALTQCIESANADLIVTTDADCIMHENWLNSIVDQYVNKGSVMIAGPVLIHPGENMFQKIQSLEYAGLVAMSAASIHAHMPMFCSGANLAFEKKAFLEVGGYTDSKSISGDDTQLMRKINDQYPGKISFLKDERAVVTTQPAEMQSDFFDQRKRWASKIPATLSSFTILIALVAWLTHVFLLLQLFSSVLNNSYELFAIFFLIKVFAEILLLQSTSEFFELKIPFVLIILIQPLYALYISVVGAIAPFAKFRWKNRPVSPDF
jgi:cellulose synthase/poly-beta-1,6-N-acetylglucosamine synthase-like glycosyltransferase